MSRWGATLYAAMQHERERALMFRPPAPRPVSSGNEQVDAAAKQHGWQAIDRGNEVAYRKAGSRDVVVSRRVLDQAVFRDRVLGQLERL